MGQCSRGRLTEAVQAVAANAKVPFPGISIRELRLMPYIQFLVLNAQKLDPRKINQEEREIVSEWRHRGFLFGGAAETVSVSRDFWDTMNDILWEAYADPNS